MGIESVLPGCRLYELFQSVRRELVAGGVVDAGREARALISAVGGFDRTEILARPERVLRDIEVDRIRQAVGKRVGGMPFGRIVGERDFYGRAFGLGPDTLEPRFDSEVLIEAVLELAGGQPGIGRSGQALRIIDIGTGTGCLLITLLAELPDAVGVGVDISPAALAVARENALRHGVLDRAEFVASDVFEDVAGTFDLLISNPPYIASDAIAGLDIEVREHDPHVALDGGVDGLEFYRIIARDVRRFVPDGWMVFEAGAGMAAGVCRTIDQIHGCPDQRNWRVWRDINGHARCVAAETLNQPAS